jgi:bifunctional non-homologous end joining protein LigD
MTLIKYKHKRNFKETSEPRGETKKSKNKLIFVVQKHDATRLHYDFRLEMEGVLKSWAVPKGPSLNPDDKRLAMMVEDHPFSYKDFEGNIPKGNYGTGQVIVWDNGTYSVPDADNIKDAERILAAGLKKGHIRFILAGKKLKGEFSLVNIKGRQENAWLLIKKNDRYAANIDVLLKNKSVISKTSLDDLESRVLRQSSAGKNAAAKFIEPMLAATKESPFDDSNWIYEIKYDGYRAIAVINKKEVNLFSRNHLSFNKNYKQIVEKLKKLNHIAVLDGEIVIEDEKGHSNFQLLQNYLKSGKGIPKYYVFDILNLDGKDTRSLTLLERKELTKIFLSKHNLTNVMYADHIKEEGVSFFKQAEKLHLEGIIAKDANSPYRSGKRTGEWLKIKITQQEEAVIIGITQPKGARRYFGAVLLAQYDGNELRYIGNCGTGFNDKSLKELYTLFQHSLIKNSPLNKKISLEEKVQWIKPKYVCQVKYSERTQDGFLRHPVYLGLRVDKNAEVVKVSLQNKKSIPLANENEYDLKISKISLHLTNQNKIYFPDDGFTKGDIVNYYKEVAEFILPYLKDRPQSMNRFPNGINGKNFYHKDVDTNKIPSWLITVKVHSDSNNGNIEYLLCNDKAALLYMANLGCIEINPWNSTIKHLDNPDWVVIDLDPGDIDFKEVVKAALTVKKVVNEWETECYCKTSGATGLHIYIPLAAKYEYDSAKIFTELIAHNVNALLPQTTSIVRSVNKRQEKIYIDFLQNRRGQTLAAPYSVRPRPGATVSTPLDWNEVNDKLNPAQFTIKTILTRLEQKGDIWKPVLGKGADLQKIITRNSKNSK